MTIGMYTIMYGNYDGSMDEEYILLIFQKNKFYYCWEATKMAKVKTLRVQKESLKKLPSLKIKRNSKVVAYSPTQTLANEDFIARALWECLKNNDPEGVMEVIQAHLEAINKLQLAKKASLARSTMYHAFKSKNPTISTLAKLIHASA